MCEICGPRESLGHQTKVKFDLDLEAAGQPATASHCQPLPVTATVKPRKQQKRKADAPGVPKLLQPHVSSRFSRGVRARPQKMGLNSSATTMGPMRMSCVGSTQSMRIAMNWQKKVALPGIVCASSVTKSRGFSKLCARMLSTAPEIWKNTA